MATKRRRSKKSSKSDAPSGTDDYMGGGELDASLQAEARRRYLNYALSVITARALPDVRDGLKPVQRRILYAMQADEKLSHEAKHKKSAKVVGAVIGRYHPHGDTAVYDAMVRMAQPFSLRLPLVDGSGNFGSLDGDSPAAYRYTEARLTAAAMQLLDELKYATVPFRANYDATAEEPTVLPARFPNLLVNGSTGIAVGMATNIPPHNLRELTKALIALADDPELNVSGLLKYIKGPDFPTGGQILNSKAELREIYEEGRGAIRVRGEYKLETQKRSKILVVTSVPYGVTKATVVERIAEVIIKRKLPQLLDVRDESTTDVRVVLEIKKDADPEMIMAYLFKHTPLQLNFNVNLTCLVPSGNDASQPAQLGLKDMLRHFLDFRYEVTERRYQFELAALLRRIHILEGFVVIFDALDETIRIIRRSDGRQDAAQKIMKKFGLDKEQVDAILELRLYRLAKLEINIIREELADKRSQAKSIEAILRSEKKLWGVVKTELGEVAELLGDARRTKTGGAAAELEFDADAYIIDEDAHVVLTRDGWLKRQRELKDPTSTRLREGDEVMAVLAGSTKEHVAFFTNYGSAYVIKIYDVPATSGYGDPVQKLFKFKDGERIVAAMAFDPRAMPPDELLTVSSGGFGQRFASEPFTQPTTRAGRKFARPPKGDEIVDVVATEEDDIVVVATRKGYTLACRSGEINKLENPGKGVTVIKTGEHDKVIGFISGGRRAEALYVESAKGGRTFELHAVAQRLTTRGGKGHQLVKRSTLKLTPQTAELPPPLANNEGNKEVH
ncbi:DNA gyrase/topoisomerase IV subunit A [Haliangium ochraceum]|uniref:DNA topoisomerase (ATP-hydrolyzing) n=1 Tax=Haliangium ochraceum (strain DSM 14365 / JCM 11303 / SMP-2) TaxID=502025 RepID=D0LGV8_HALO1|nr:DNA topoisomerase IV subunit A [Haliangium ochraceum]ACY14680.1 DNA topoisomerase (ATP-hydrolyzing) [Haliangium ochraceum DSM 14365]